MRSLPQRDRTAAQPSRSNITPTGTSVGYGAITAEQVRDAALELEGITLGQLVEDRSLRTVELMLQRQRIVGPMRELPTIQPSFPDIGRLICQQTHTTAMHTYRRWQAMQESVRLQWLAAVRERVLERNARLNQSTSGPSPAGGPRAGASLPRGSAR